MEIQVRNLSDFMFLPWVNGDINVPISKYFKGHGSEVMSNMKKEYGPKKGKRVFYATANKRKQNPPKR